MIEVESRVYEAIWGMIVVVLVAGWAVFAILDRGSDIFLAGMVAATILLGGGAAVLLKSRPKPGAEAAEED